MQSFLCFLSRPQSLEWCNFLCAASSGENEKVVFKRLTASKSHSFGLDIETLGGANDEFKFVAILLKARSDRLENFLVSVNSNRSARRAMFR